jgi:hypothetical protein
LIKIIYPIIWGRCFFSREYDVITALSKASLFNAIVAAVETKLGGNPY